MKYALIMIRAALRLSPRMFIYMLRRKVRNIVVPKFPSIYARRLKKFEQTLTPLVQPNEIQSGLKECGRFYCEEYRHMIDDGLTGKITLHSKVVDFSDPKLVDWNYSLEEEGDHQMWRVKLGHMGFLTPMLIEGDEGSHFAVNEYLVNALSNAKPSDKGAFNGFWFPYAASHRVLALTSALLITRHNNEISMELDKNINRLIKSSVAFILDNIEHELQNNHIERNLAALCMFFTYAENTPPKIKNKLNLLIERLLNKTILPDGCQIERSPMYQGLSIVSLGVIVETPFLNAQLKERLVECLNLARQAFAALCHPDGEVALFNDSWHSEVPNFRLESPLNGRVILPDGGFGRISMGSDICILDGGAIGPSWNPGHGHADFLSIEISLNGERTIVDPGTSCYNSGRQRASERSAAAHNGPIWRGLEAVEFVGCFKVGRMIQAYLLEEDLLPDDTLISFINYKQGTVVRTVRYFNGRGYLINDFWDNSQDVGQVSFLIPRKWDLCQSESRIILTNLDCKVFMDFPSGYSKQKIETGTWARKYGLVESAHKIRLYPIPNQMYDCQRLTTWIGHESCPQSIQVSNFEEYEKVLNLIKKSKYYNERR